MSTSNLFAPFIQVKEALVSYQSRIADNPSHIIYTLGLLGFYWYGLTVFMGPDGHLIAVGLLLFAFFGYWFRCIWPDLRKCSLFWVSLATTVYFLLRTFIACWEFPEIIPFQIKMGLKLVHMGGISALLLVPWLNKKEKPERVDLFWLMILISFLCNVYLTLSLSNFWDIISLQNHYYIKDQLRVNPNTAGLLAGVLLLGLLTIGLKNLQELKRILSNYLFGLTSILWASTIWILVLLIINSNSRSGWIAIATIVPVSIIILCYVYLHKSKKLQKTAYLIVSCFVLLLIIIGWFNGDKVIQQFQNEMSTINQVAQLQINNLPKHSLGKRIELWKLGLDTFKTRPLIGWGPGTVKYLIKKKGKDLIRDLGHFHSAFFQLLTQFGVLGILLFFSQVVISIYEIIKSYQLNIISIEWMIFLSGTFGMYLIFSSVNSPFHHEQYRYMIIIMLAISIVCQMSRKIQFKT